MIDAQSPTTKMLTRRPSSFVFRLLPHAIILVAFLLRAYRLADQNIWWDEGWSVWLSQKDLGWIALRTAMDEHPPLHYWLLHFWNFVAGTDAFAGRFISVAFGVLTIALIYRMGRQVGGKWIGILAALFLAVARFHIWWSQDIKNYTLSMFFAFAAVWFALKIISDFRFQIADLKSTNSQFAIRNSIIGYAICAALAMWTHYLAALVLLALNLYWLLVIVRSSFVPHSGRPSSVVRRWLIANLLAAFLFAPWLYLYLQNAAAWTAAPPFDFVLFIKLVATVLPLGITTNIDNYAGLTIAFTTLVVLGCIPQKAEDTKHLAPTAYRLLPTLIVALPPLLVYALSLTPVSFFAPKIQARYLLILLPAYTILLAFGVVLLRRFSMWLAVAATLFILGANILGLNDYYTERRLTDEYATLANTINAFARQGDVVLLDTDQEWPTLLYYLRAPLDWLGASNGKPMTEADADALVRRVLNRSNAVWLVTIPDALATDPQKLLEARLTRDLPKQYEKTFDDKRLVLHARDGRDLVNVVPGNFEPQFQRAEKSDDDLIWLGFDLPVHEILPGESLLIATYWRTTIQAHGELRLILYRIDGSGIIHSVPLDLPVGENIRVVTDLKIPPDLIPGQYALQTVMSYKGSMFSSIFASITVRHGDAETAQVDRIPNTVDYSFGNAIHLLGYDLSQRSFRAGERILLNFYWRADDAVEKNYTLFVHVRGEQFNPRKNNPLWGQNDGIPRIPTFAWQPNQVIFDPHNIIIDSDAPPGKYKIEIGMYATATGARLPVNGGDSIVIAEIEIIAQ